MPSQAYLKFVAWKASKNEVSLFAPASSLASRSLRPSPPGHATSSKRPLRGVSGYLVSGSATVVAEPALPGRRHEVQWRIGIVRAKIIDAFAASCLSFELVFTAAAVYTGTQNWDAHAHACRTSSKPHRSVQPKANVKQPKAIVNLDLVSHYRVFFFIYDTMLIHLTLPSSWLASKTLGREAVGTMLCSPPSLLEVFSLLVNGRNVYKSPGSLAATSFLEVIHRSKALGTQSPRTLSRAKQPTQVTKSLPTASPSSTWLHQRRVRASSQRRSGLSPHLRPAPWRSTTRWSWCIPVST